MRKEAGPGTYNEGTYNEGTYNEGTYNEGLPVFEQLEPTALHTEGTAQVSEWFNISDTTKKLY